MILDTLPIELIEVDEKVDGLISFIKLAYYTNLKTYLDPKLLLICK